MSKLTPDEIDFTKKNIFRKPLAVIIALCFPLGERDELLLFEKRCVTRVIQKRREKSDQSQKTTNTRFSICHTAKACL